MARRYSQVYHKHNKLISNSAVAILVMPSKKYSPMQLHLVIWHDVEQDGVRLAFKFQKINANLKFGSRAFVQLRGIDERSALAAGEVSDAMMATGSWATRLNT